MDDIEKCVEELRNWVKTRPYYDYKYNYFSKDSISDCEIYCLCSDFSHSLKYSGLSNKNINFLLVKISYILLKYNIKTISFSGERYFYNRGKYIEMN